ncbi:MAG TPA: serine hydrolase domain-containing protein [Acidimicrobiales bacterium]|nr:serine hydrolase domain-containing protein [Acidimicrobiales bacterium]
MTEPDPGPLALVDAWPVPHAAAGVVGRPDPAAGGRPPVLALRGEAGLRQPWASVTKLATALATLVAHEEGILTLDDPAGPPGATIRHLLAHASGLAFDRPDPVAAPGRRRIYSNAGFEVVAGAVARAADMAFGVYLHEAVLQPLAMGATRLEGSPAADLVGPLDDLLRLAGELLAPTLVAPETLRAATAVAFPGLAGVLPGFGRHARQDWGLGFEVRDAKSPHWTGAGNSPATFGHFGACGSFLWVDPEAGLACAALSGRDFGEWAKAAWPALGDAVLAALGPAGTGLA